MTARLPDHPACGGDLLGLMPTPPGAAGTDSLGGAALPLQPCRTLAHEWKVTYRTGPGPGPLASLPNPPWRRDMGMNGNGVLDTYSSTHVPPRLSSPRAQEGQPTGAWGCPRQPWGGHLLPRGIMGNS